MSMRGETACAWFDNHDVEHRKPCPAAALEPEIRGEPLPAVHRW